MGNSISYTAEDMDYLLSLVESRDKLLNEEFMRGGFNIQKAVEITVNQAVTNRLILAFKVSRLKTGGTKDYNLDLMKDYLKDIEKNPSKDSILKVRDISIFEAMFIYSTEKMPLYLNDYLGIVSKWRLKIGK